MKSAIKMDLPAQEECVEMNTRIGLVDEYRKKGVEEQSGVASLDLSLRLDQSILDIRPPPFRPLFAQAGLHGIVEDVPNGSLQLGFVSLDMIIAFVVPERA